MNMRLAWRKYRRHIPMLLSLCILGVSVVYGTWFASYTLSTNTDAIVPPYLFQGGTISNASFLGAHSNLVKFPLFYLQSLLPYNIYSFTLVNIFLNLLTVALLIVLFLKLFSQKYLFIPCLSLSLIFIASPTFNLLITSASIRNMEYPIVLAFYFLMAKVITSSNITSKLAGWLIGVGVAYSAVMAGDRFFLYTSIPTILFIIGMLYWRSHHLKPKKEVLFSLFITLGAIVLSFLFYSILKITRVSLHTGDDLVPKIISQEDIGHALSGTFFKLFDLFGANIFSSPITSSRLILFANLLLIFIGMSGLIGILIHSKKINTHSSVPSITLYLLSLWSIITPFIFIFSGLALIKLPDGSYEIVIRYLTILPFLLPFFVTHWAKELQPNQFRLIKTGLPILFISSLTISLPYVSQINTTAHQSRYVSYIKSIIAKAEQNHIQTLVTGYWYGAPIRLWSQNKIDYAAVTHCTVPSPPINNKKAMYAPTHLSKTTGLAVVRAGTDMDAWQCSDQSLKSFYGTPKNIIPISSSDGKSRVELWIYNYDVRTRFPYNTIENIFKN